MCNCEFSNSNIHIYIYIYMYIFYVDHFVKEYKINVGVIKNKNNLLYFVDLFSRKCPQR